ncbi:MAG TPA: hypothetical protein VHP36_02550 [Chitinispirillaceae bacterium]|nr:hypothetical protein [Chitinispirillaceae bacterium]
MRKEIELLGALHIAISILYTLVFTATYAVLFTKGFFSGNYDSVSINFIVYAVVGAFLLLFAVSGVIAAMGIINSRPWAQMMILILGCLNLICIPLGTALGVYTIWIYMHNDRNKPEPINTGISSGNNSDDKQCTSMDTSVQFPGKNSQI